MELCGLIKTDDGEIADIAVKMKGVNYDLVWNNDPFGVVTMYGFNNLAIKSFNKTQIVEKDGSNVSTFSDMWVALYNMLKQQTRGEAVGIILLEDGLLLIKSTTPFEAVKQPLKMGSAPEERYTGSVDIGDLDEDSEDFDNVVYLLELL